MWDEKLVFQTREPEVTIVMAYPVWIADRKVLRTRLTYLAGSRLFGTRFAFSKEATRGAGSGVFFGIRSWTVANISTQSNAREDECECVVRLVCCTPLVRSRGQRSDRQLGPHCVGSLLPPWPGPRAHCSSFVASSLTYIGLPLKMRWSLSSYIYYLLPLAFRRKLFSAAPIAYDLSCAHTIQISKRCAIFINYNHIKLALRHNRGISIAYDNFFKRVNAWLTTR